MSGPGFGHDRPVALITGATSGIGLALAHRLSARYRLVLTGRRPAAEIRGGLPPGAHYVAADQAGPGTATAAILNVLDAQRIAKLDRVILNAGGGRYGPPADETPEIIAMTLAVNLAAPIMIARALAPRLERASGRLTLVGSVARKGARRSASYAATKAGLHGLARALDQEWRGRIAVQIVHPGPVATGMHMKAGFDPGRLRHLFLSPDAAAGAIARLIETSRPVMTISVRTKLAAILRGGRR